MRPLFMSAVSALDDLGVAYTHNEMPFDNADIFVLDNIPDLIEALPVLVGIDESARVSACAVFTDPDDCPQWAVTIVWGGPTLHSWAVLPDCSSEHEKSGDVDAAVAPIIESMLNETGLPAVAACAGDKRHLGYAVFEDYYYAMLVLTTMMPHFVAGMVDGIVPVFMERFGSHWIVMFHTASFRA